MGVLRAEREKRGWTRLDMARKLREASASPREIPSLNILTQYVYRWERGTAGVSERYQIMYCRAFDLPRQELFGDARRMGTESESPGFPLSLTGGGYVVAVLPRGQCQFTLEVSGTIISTELAQDTAGRPQQPDGTSGKSLTLVTGDKASPARTGGTN